MSRSMTLLAALLLTVGLVACGGGSDDADARERPDGSGGDAGAQELGRVVALGEEFLLADLLALGITPVASTATQSDAGFQGLDAFDTDGITPYPSYEANLEALAAERADVIVATEFIVGQVGRDVLEAAAADELIVVGDAGGTEQLDEVAAAFGREEEAEALEAELEDARSAAVASVPDDCEVSLGTIYPDRSPAAWIAAPNAAAIVVEELGCELSPSTETADPDGSGRIYLSLEEVGLLDAPLLVLLQSDVVPGEADALAAMDAEPLWQQLPAVEAGEVHQIDRLGYPGVAGQVRLYEDLAAILGGTA